MTTLQHIATVRGGHCSMGTVWESHIEDGGFRSIDFVWGTERKDVYNDERPALTGDKVRVTVSDSNKDVPLRNGWFVRNGWFGREPIRRISKYSAIVRGGWPTRHGSFGLSKPDYWYVTLEPELPFDAKFNGGEPLTFNAQLGTLAMPFPVGRRVWITVDLMEARTPRHQEAPLENYTYSC